MCWLIKQERTEFLKEAVPVFSAVFWVSKKTDDFFQGRQITARSRVRLDNIDQAATCHTVALVAIFKTITLFKDTILQIARRRLN